MIGRLASASSLQAYTKPPSSHLFYSFEEEKASPAIGLPFYVDNQGKLYTTKYDPYPQVRRYRLEITGE